jgi:tetratricopeptide (TPR) repeat protein
MRALVLFLFAAAAVATPTRASAEPPAGTKKPKVTAKDKKPAPPPPEPRKPGPHDAKVVAVLEKIVAGPDSVKREAAIAELQKLAPDALEAIGEWIPRAQGRADVVVRREVLVAINASIPDKTGKFSTPQRQTGKEKKADDELDWLKALLALDPATPGVGEVIADVAAIRALAATKELRAAQLVFDVAFSEQSMIYRDECGRYLRKLEPYSIPALTREALGRNADRRRYATWQLERLDRQDAAKALAAATGNEALQIAILETFRETRYREGVHAVWMYVNNDAPRVRAAARATWMSYITGKAPPPAPRKKLQMPGGKLTKEEKPMWLTYRELADNELRKAANELLHEDYPIEEPSIDDRIKQPKITPIDLEDVTQRLFAYYDGERTKIDTTQWQAAKAKADGGDLAGAAGLLDRLITTNPERAERGEMAKVYLAYGKQLEDAQKWPEASATYSKAHGLDPKPHTLAAHHFTLGKALEAQGKDGGPNFRRAVALDPEYAPAKTAADRVASADKPAWMLYAAIVAGGLAMLLFAAAMMRRRA